MPERPRRSSQATGAGYDPALTSRLVVAVRAGRESTRFLVAAGVTAALLAAAAAAKHRAALHAVPDAQRALAPLSSWVAPLPPIPSAPLPPVDPAARVEPGPPRMYHLDPARTNRSPFAGPDAPHTAWTFDAGAPIEAAPAVLADGTVVFATLAGRLFGVSPAGEQVFATELHDRVYASPLVHDDTLYVGSDDDKLFALSTAGKPRWVLATDGDADTAPTWAPWGAVVFAAGNTLIAARVNGTVAWRVKAKRKIYSAPAVSADGTVYAGAQDHRLIAVRNNGTIRFALDLGADVDCAPAVDDDGTVYVGTDGGWVVAVDPESGSVRWRAGVDGHVRGGVTITRRHQVIVGVYGPSPRVVCLDAATGREVWSFRVPGTGAREFGVHGSPVEDARGALYFGAQDDTVYALEPSGALRWKLRTGGDVDAPVVLADSGVLLVASDDGKLYCVRGAEPSSATTTVDTPPNTR